MDEARRRVPAWQHFDQAAGGEVLPDHHHRELDDADPGVGGVAQRRHVVGDQAGRVPDRRRPAVVVAELPDVLAMWRTEIEARQEGKVGGGFDGLRHERGAGD